MLDINKKQKIKSFLLNYSAYSICYINGNIFLGLKHDKSSCILFQYIINKKNGQINLECIGKGRDKCNNITFIDSLGEKVLITYNKDKYIKIWEETEEKPKLLLVENNTDYNFEEGYDSENEYFNTPEMNNNHFSKSQNSFNLFENEDCPPKVFVSCNLSMSESINNKETPGNNNKKI